VPISTVIVPSMRYGAVSSRPRPHDERLAVNDREWMRPAFEAPDAAQRLEGYAAAVRLINQRAGNLFGVLDVAASVDDFQQWLAGTMIRELLG
jgi:hypothetical protein